MLKISVLSKKFTNFTGKITREFLGLTMETIFRVLFLHQHKRIGRFSNLHQCTLKDRLSSGPCVMIPEVKGENYSSSVVIRLYLQFLCNLKFVIKGQKDMWSVKSKKFQKIDYGINVSCFYGDNTILTSEKIIYRLSKLVTFNSLYGCHEFTKTLMFQYLYRPCQKLYKYPFILWVTNQNICFTSA